uniref:Uncharacterized protein n=1 Tax=Rhizophora mucronata TaxID=61149 RepID=A0A2P2ITK7_RHIMU
MAYDPFSKMHYRRLEDLKCVKKMQTINMSL